MKKNYEPAILWPGLFIGLSAIHPLFLFAVFISLHKYREPWIKQINQQFSTYQWWYFAFPIFAFFISYLKALPFAPDDLMMHVVAYKFSYDYHSIFTYSPLQPNYNPWFGFQIVAGKFHQLFGPEYSVRIIQAIAVVSFYTSFFLALHKILEHRSDKWLWCTIIFALCSPASFRVFLGRPDIFFTAWLIAAIFLRPIVWLIIGIAIMPAYSLSILYAPGALLLNTSWRNRIIYAVLFSISCIAFWYFYSQGEWLNLAIQFSNWSDNKLIEIAETLSVTYIFSNAYLLGLIILLYYFLSKSSFKLIARASSFCLLIAYFLLPNYIRYILPIVILIGLMCALYVPKEIKLNPTSALIIFIFASLILSKAVPNTPYEKLPAFKIPEGAIVLTQFDEGLYSGILHNPSVKFSPSPIIWTTDKSVQSLVLKLDRGEQIDCNELKKHSFTYLQENHLKKMSSCLNLSQIDGNWRLWEIKK